MPQQDQAMMPTDGLPRRERLQAMIAIAVAVALATLDTAVTNTALPTIAADIGSNSAAAIWIVNAYQFVMVATLLPLASLGEVVGHRRLYIAGLVLFTLTSFACGMAWSLPTLVIARALQGLGAAAIMSVNTALIRFIYPSGMLGRGVGVNALVVAIFFTIGPTVTSAVLSVASWHWLFLMNVPASLVAIVLSLRTLPITKGRRNGFDMVAASLCTSFLALLVCGFAAIAHGSGWLIIVAEWAGAAACGYALLRREAGRAAPILAIDLLRQPVFSLSALTSICTYTTQGLAFVSLPFLLQNAMSYSQVETGFLITPWPAVVAIMAPIAGRLSDRYSPGFLGGGGLVVLSIGMASLASLSPAAGIPTIIWRLALCGAGFGFFQSPNLRALMGSAPPERSGGASGVVATSRLLGQGMGAALVALCLTASPAKGPELALWAGGAFAAVGAVASFLRLMTKPTHR